MTVTATTATGASALGTGSVDSASSRAQFAQTFDTFLTMLTTQLKNQDPLSPMDSTEFTTQLVQFASVEQQINANQKLEQLLYLQYASQVSTAVDYIGRTVEAVGNRLPLQDGQAEFAYVLPSDARTVTIEISDSSGKVIRTMSGEIDAGTHTVTWDGSTDDGGVAPDGAYTVDVVGVDTEGEAITANTMVTGYVDAVSMADGAIMLSLGEVDVALSTVSQVKAEDRTE